MSNVLGQIKIFFARQSDNFRVLLTTAVLSTSARELTAGVGGSEGGGSQAGGASYLQLYIRAVGADPQQIGLVNSAGRVANAIFALPLGWLSDRFSLKKIIIVGLLLSVMVPTAFALSTNWMQMIPIMMAYSIMTVLLGMFINVFFVTSIAASADRGTAMTVKSTLTSLVGLAVPTVSTIIVSHYGGISVEGIRPLFIIQLVAGVLITIYAAFRLKEVAFLQKKVPGQNPRSLFQDYAEVANNSAVRKWTICKSLRGFFQTALLPFYSLFYVEMKGADPVIIGAMGTISVLGALAFLIPFGRLADKHGRKKIIYLTRPFNYISILITIIAPSPEYLILAALFGALQTVSRLMEITMEHELVPPEQRGRWGGFLFFIMNLVGIPGPLLIGYLWERLNPAHLLLLPILADLPFILVLQAIPDTLHLMYDDTPST